MTGSLSPALPFDPLRPPDNPGMGRGFAIAAIAHAALLAALSAGVHWRTETPPAFEAELWSALPQAAAPKEQLPPEPEPEPTPPPKPVQAPPPPPPAEDLQAEREAEIAIAKAKEKKKQELLEAKREAEREAQRKKDELAKKEKEREKAEKKAAEEKEKQKQEKLDKLEKQKQDKLAKDAAAKKDAAREAKAEAQRQENLRRIQGMAGASGAPNASGSALQSSGPSANYAGRIKARVRPNIIYPDTGSANPVAEVEVRTAPDGNIIARKILKASGDNEWDNAVLRAIDKTAVLPRDTDGRVPSVLIISFKPRE